MGGRIGETRTAARWGGGLTSVERHSRHKTSHQGHWRSHKPDTWRLTTRRIRHRSAVLLGFERRTVGTARTPSQPLAVNVRELRKTMLRCFASASHKPNCNLLIREGVNWTVGPATFWLGTNGSRARFRQSGNVRFGPPAACRRPITRPSASRRKRSFKDGLTEQMNSFDECRLSP